VITAIAIVAIALILPKDIVNLHFMILVEKELCAFSKFWNISILAIWFLSNDN
jgi:hypothetical protein